MDELDIHHERPTPAKLEVMGVEHWPTSRRAPSTFPCHYRQQETCYIVRGRLRVTPRGGTPHEFGRGDLIRFPAGLACTWEVIEAVEKHYLLE
ncbi:cupin domain-containing protein [Marichromatium bheemlicum]|uniref:Cupin domain-containing protein n=1 Tax=Marichromatium bheemlicum TaxID=365339 RepID=A0ABX1I7T2_9GAMM|nr:cupin domain-containing protein [Marichromatium bheemlicum]NKN32280.1 cupin domain-containing protein [Marichromatium bheemlicum]